MLVCSRFHFSPHFQNSEISAKTIRHDLSIQMVPPFAGANSTCHTNPEMQMFASL